MTGNSSSFIMFQSQPFTSIVTLANGSTFYVRGSKTIHATPQITLTSILRIPQLSFNLTSMSKLTHTLTSSISFFSKLFYDLGSFDEVIYW